jgi:hypothetical protein
MGRSDAEQTAMGFVATDLPTRAARSRRVTLPLEPLEMDRGQGGAAGTIDDLIAAIGPSNLRLIERTPHCLLLGEPPIERLVGETVILYYGTGPRKAGDIAAGDTSGIGAGPAGYFGAGVYLTGDTYTALRVAESACEKEGLYGYDAVHQPAVPINFFVVEADVGRVCDLKGEAGVLRQWAWREFGLYEPEMVLRLIPAFLAAHGYDTAVLRHEAGVGQDYWVIPDRSRLTLIEHTVLLPGRNLIGQRCQMPGSPIRLEHVLAQVPLDATVLDAGTLTPAQIEQLDAWKTERSSVSPREAFRLEGEQRQQVRRWLHGKLPGSAAAFARQCLMVEGLGVEASQRTGMEPERWAQLYRRTHETGEWDGDIVGRAIELLLLKPSAYRTISEALYWAVRQYVRRSGW